jgi:hypothetical protein
MQETLGASLALSAEQLIDKNALLLQRRRKALKAQIAALQFEKETEGQESRQLVAQQQLKLQRSEQDQKEMARSRSGSAGYESNAGRELVGAQNDRI